MARPEADYKIRPGNTSSYNIIAHDRYIPPSPPFGPVYRNARIDPTLDYESPRASDRKGYQTSREQERDQWNQSSRKLDSDYKAALSYRDTTNDIEHLKHVPATPLFRPDGAHGENIADNRRDGLTEGRREEATLHRDYQPKQNVTGQGFLGDTIGNVNRVPVSPLYLPGMGKGLNMADPRYGSPQRRGAPKFQETKRPKQPPTPDYNTTGIHINEDRGKAETKLQLGDLRGSQEDLRDYRSNNATWAGYQDRPAYQEPPVIENRGDKTNRENPWTSRNQVLSFVGDPRYGGYHDNAAGIVGNRNGGALLFVRFALGQGENANIAAQAFLKSKTQDTGGRFIGMAKKVFDFGYERAPAEGIGVFHFPTIEKATIFFQSDPLLRQPDFPPPNGYAESWIVKNSYLPDNLELFSTFLLSEIELHSGKDKKEFYESFQKPFETYLYKNGAMPFVVCSYGETDRKSVRRHMYPPSAIVTCHLFQGLDHLNWITNDETYSKYRSLHNQLAVEKCSIFNIHREMFP